MFSSATEQLRLFLRDFVSSYDELDVLLFLASGPRRDWTGAEVAAELRKPKADVDAALEALSAVGLLAARQGEVGAYRYAAGDETIRVQVMELQKACDEQKLSIVQMMSKNALERIRSSAIRRLAAAFRPGKAKK